MDVYTTEASQVAAIQSFFKRYGKYLLAAILLAALGIFGWQYAKHWQQTKREGASDAYQQLLLVVQKGNEKDIKHQSQAIIEKYKATPYADWAKLLLTKVSLSQNNWMDAKSMLESVMQKPSGEPFRQLAIIQLARLYLAQKEPDESLKVLNKLKSPLYRGWAAMIKGDAYQQKNDLANAKVAYKKALSSLPKNQVTYELVQMKLHNLPAKTAKKE